MINNHYINMLEKKMFYGFFYLLCIKAAED